MSTDSAAGSAEPCAAAAAAMRISRGAMLGFGLDLCARLITASISCRSMSRAWRIRSGSSDSSDEVDGTAAPVAAGAGAGLAGGLGACGPGVAVSGACRPSPPLGPSAALATATDTDRDTDTDQMRPEAGTSAVAMDAGAAAADADVAPDADAARVAAAVPSVVGMRVVAGVSMPPVTAAHGICIWWGWRLPPLLLPPLPLPRPRIANVEDGQVRPLMLVMLHA